MRTLGTLVFFLFLLATCWLLANRASRRNKLLNGPLALAILIAVEAVMLNVLSLWHGVSAFSLAFGNLMVIAAVLYVLCRRSDAREVMREYGALVKRQADFWSGRSNPLALLVAPLLAILLFTAFVYPPNNWDSMTYHMARVLYWMQNGSISYFPTTIDRQNLMNPGAEYVILLLQSLSGTDSLANFVQFVSYLLLVSATPSFLRLLGIQRRLANWGVILTASLPMGVLQATSTQNDLVAACLGLALAAAALRLWHTNSRISASRTDITVVALLGAVGYLVKATAVIAAAPFLLIAGVCFCRVVLPRRQWWRGQVLSILLGLCVVAVVAGPDLYRKKVYIGSFTAARHEVFPLLGFWRDKLLHSVEGINFHVIPATGFYRSVVVPLVDSLNGGTFPMPQDPLSLHEDLAGNPLHMLFAAGALLLFFCRYTRIPRAGRWAVWCVCGSWIILHASIRYQPWISRLQTPVFMLFPCFLAALATNARIRSKNRIGTFLVFIFAMPCLAYGFVAATRNQSRYVKLTDAWRLDRDSAYYANRRPLKSQHDQVLATIKGLQVHKVGLAIGGDEYDYPLSWRIYRSGMEVRHTISESELAWADVVYASVEKPTGARNWTERGGILINPRFLK